MPDAIFISYRRDDSEGEAGRLFDDLTRAFGAENVFMDVAGIKPGADFRDAIERGVAGCGVLLAIIGPIWATLSDANGLRRLEAPNDFVALEIGHALARDIPVIPVLVHDARMPQPGQLPDALKLLAYRNGVELSHARWSSDVQTLIGALKNYVPPPAALTQPSTFKSPPPAPLRRPAPMPPPPKPRSMAPLIAILLVGIVVVGIALAVAVSGGGSAHAPPLADGGTMPVLGTPPMPPDELGQPKKNPSSEEEPQKPPAAAEMGGAASSAANETPWGTEGAGPTTATGEALTGTWVDTSLRSGNSLDRLVIERVPAGLAVHAFGWCPPNQCDWGTQLATLQSNMWAVEFYPIDPSAPYGSMRRTDMLLKPDGDALMILVNNTFSSPGAGVQANRIQLRFVRAQQGQR